MKTRQLSNSWSGVLGMSRQRRGAADSRSPSLQPGESNQHVDRHDPQNHSGNSLWYT